MTRTTDLRGMTLLVLAIATTACQTPGGVTQARADDSCAAATIATSGELFPLKHDAAKIPMTIKWYRNSAERSVLSAQTYQAACRAVTAKATGLTGLWGVIMDADETVLDNSEFQTRLAEAGEQYSDPAWEAWAREGRAMPLPGAKEFIDVVHMLGGRVYIVTNRKQVICEDTRMNLAKHGLKADGIACRTAESDKNQRFKAVADGAHSNGTPVRVVAYVGDNILDFPALSQGTRDASRFGIDFFLVPNPMYGSFTDVPFN